MKPSDLKTAYLKRNVIAELREKAKPAKAKPAAKVKPAAAKVQPTAAKPGELAAHLIYCHPDDPSQTWSGKGQQPAWVKALLATGGGLDVREKFGVKPTAKPTSTPVNAARADGKGATAAPAEGKAEAPKTAKKKPKSKADPAPASPANEAAAPPKQSGLSPMPAWPFPIGARA